MSETMSIFLQQEFRKEAISQHGGSIHASGELSQVINGWLQQLPLARFIRCT